MGVGGLMDLRKLRATMLCLRLLSVDACGSDYSLYHVIQTVFHLGNRTASAVAGDGQDVKTRMISVMPSDGTAPKKWWGPNVSPRLGPRFSGWIAKTRAVPRDCVWRDE